MNALWRRALAAACFFQPSLFAPSCTVFAQTAIGQPEANITSREQISFSAEDTQVRQPVRVPVSVVRIVSRDAAVQELLKDEPSHELPAGWLSAAEVHLGGSGERDLLVMGIGLLRGANVTPFWLFAPMGDSFRLLLATGGHDLKIKNTRSGGYRDIDVLAATAVDFSRVSYRYVGGVYKRSDAKVEKIP